MKKYFNQKGMTLIEIIVVVLIIVLIASVIIISLEISKRRTMDESIKSYLLQVQSTAEMVYNPVHGYRELYEMIDSDYVSIKRIEEEIEKMGKDFVLLFPEGHGITRGYNEYCAYSFLFTNPDKVFCVDHLGNAVIRKASDIHCPNLWTPEFNCESM